jgi:hypothetical protein
MAALIATGESGCTYHSGASATLTLSGVAVAYCDSFANAGRVPGDLVDLHVAKDTRNWAIYADAIYAPGLIVLPASPLKSSGTLADGDVVQAMAVVVAIQAVDVSGLTAIIDASVSAAIDNLGLPDPTLAADGAVLTTSGGSYVLTGA